jgi:hypothetical protein
MRFEMAFRVQIKAHFVHYFPVRAFCTAPFLFQRASSVPFEFAFYTEAFLSYFPRRRIHFSASFL